MINSQENLQMIVCVIDMLFPANPPAAKDKKDQGKKKEQQKKEKDQQKKKEEEKARQSQDEEASQNSQSDGTFLRYFLRILFYSVIYRGHRCFGGRWGIYPPSPAEDGKKNTVF